METAESDIEDVITTSAGQNGFEGNQAPKAVLLYRPAAQSLRSQFRGAEPALPNFAFTDKQAETKLPAVGRQ